MPNLYWDRERKGWVVILLCEESSSAPVDSNKRLPTIRHCFSHVEYVVLCSYHSPQPSQDVTVLADH